MKILITGGSGFIGTHLYNQLHKEHTVYRIDNFKTSKKVDGVIPMDLSDLSEAQILWLRRLLVDIDVVYHFASSIGVDLIGEEPKETLQNSFKINNTMFPLFEEAQCKVIYASTSEVYGSSEKPMSERDKLVIGAPTQMRWGYACQKLMSEFLIKTYTFPYTVVRFFNVTGRGQLPTYGMVLPRFVEASKNAKNALQVYGDGSQVRSFCDVRDAVNVLEILLTEMNGEILNIGADNVIDMLQLAEMVIELSPVFADIEMIPEARTNAEINTRIPDISKMKTIYTPKYSLQNIIESMF